MSNPPTKPPHSQAPRSPTSGRFCFSLNAKVCECGAILRPVEKMEGRFVVREWPATCHQCGRTPDT